MRKIFDSHLHIIDPRFPLIKNQDFLPEPFTCQDYKERVDDLQIVGGAVVSGSFQGFDQTYLIDALQALGKNFVGVTQLPYGISDEDILELNNAGVRALRFNVQRSGNDVLSKLNDVAKRVYELAGWHVELYIDSNYLPEIVTTLESLPAVSIDHLGLSKEGLKHLFYLVDKGVRVKATGFGRGNLDIEKTLKSIYAINPAALMFGTDLPSTRAKRPYDHSDIELVYNALSTSQAENVLYKNALDWYLTKR
ncbi:amidohydrolase family protein [Salipaludibacillus sp. LMS25]|uniref:amidohydrolase family protein n=1 Tax=Salipaludibacillus sp. LMS25 TaxID=2924031 RepID=UPI0020D1A92F|nr:amidohydrolase family protein [Salipaludibacillus sp. LMS25]UTR16125.1 amidohydrolase family protein [Salipaludibacillus sp. LMS25]